MMQHPTLKTLRPIVISVTLALIALAGCTPPQNLGDAAPEPVFAPPPEVTERKAMPNPCDEDDDGIGGTGCRIE